MKPKHATDDFSLSEAEFIQASGYWRGLFSEFDLLSGADCHLLDLHRFVNGALDLEAGALFTMKNGALRKAIRITQSRDLRKAFVVAYLSKWEIASVEYDFLCLDCCPTRRIEGLMLLLSFAWMHEGCTVRKMDELLKRFLQHETFEEPYE